MTDATDKRCNTCGAIKPETAEHFYYRKESGRYRDQCKDCFKQARYERYWHDPEHESGPAHVSGAFVTEARAGVADQVASSQSADDRAAVRSSR